MTEIELWESASNYSRSLRSLQHRMNYAEQTFTTWNSAPHKLAITVRANPMFREVETRYQEVQYAILRGTITTDQLDAFCILVADLKEQVIDPAFIEFRNVLDTKTQTPSDLSEV